jgi:ADP-ribose pyrophosphatase YjhB (NUDIX family)
VNERKKARKAGGRSEPASEPARIETSAGGVVFRRAGETLFLLIRDPYENWGLPKGHIEQGETPQQAAVRETAEETGLVVDVRQELPTIDWYFRDHGTLVHKFCHFFLMEAREGEARPQVEEGISACVWLPLGEALTTLTYANAREVLRSAARSLTKAGDAVSTGT